MRTIFFHEFTRAAFVASHLKGQGFAVEYTGGEVMRTNAPKAAVRAVPDGYVRTWD